MPEEKSKIMGAQADPDYGFLGEQPANVNPDDIMDKTVDFLQQQINDILDIVDKKFIDGELNHLDPDLAVLHNLFSQLSAAQTGIQKGIGAAVTKTNKVVGKPINATQEFVAHQPAPMARGLAM